jgi:hypothetical protein
MPHRAVGMALSWMGDGDRNPHAVRPCEIINLIMAIEIRRNEG